MAAETVAAERRRTSGQLVKWYEDGWQWYGVRCRFDTMGDEYEASLWGIDDAEYAERDIKVEMALDVAAQLEKAGFTVTGKPEHGPGSRIEPYREARAHPPQPSRAELGSMKPSP